MPQNLVSNQNFLRKNYIRIFSLHYFLIIYKIAGVCSGTLGIARLRVFPINIIIKNATDLENVSQLRPIHTLALILISLALTVLGGSIPPKMAAKKDPVEALRSE